MELARAPSGDESSVRRGAFSDPTGDKPPLFNGTTPGFRGWFQTMPGGKTESREGANICVSTSTVAAGGEVSGVFARPGTAVAPRTNASVPRTTRDV